MSAKAPGDYWEIQTVVKAHDGGITISDGTSFGGSSVSGLRVGDVIAMRRTPSISCFGSVHRCVLLSRGGWRAGEQSAFPGETI